jgi:hypothetical protein
MPLQLIRAVKNPPEGLYAFRFELRAGNNRAITLTTDFNGKGIYRILARKPTDKDGPSAAWRCLCFAAHKCDVLEQSLETATELLGPQCSQIDPTLTAEQAAHALLALDLAPYDKIELRADTAYLDETPKRAYKEACIANGCAPN